MTGVRILLIGPTSQPLDALADAVARDLDRLARPGVELTYRCTGTGPATIRSAADAEAAAPGVVDLARHAARAGCDGIVVDCTDDPGVEEADRELTVPVVGPGEALRVAALSAPRPVIWLSGDDLRAGNAEDLVRGLDGAATVVLGGTGWSDVADRLARVRPELVVLDPLPVALDRCLARIAAPAR